MTSKKKRAKEQNKIGNLPPRKTETEYKSTDANDLFNNPMVIAAQSAMTAEDKQKFQKLGESMFKGINFETAEIEPPIEEAVAYIESSIRAGLHISALEDNEKAVLADVHGEEWYLRYNYVKEDIDDIYTVSWEGF